MSRKSLQIAMALSTLSPGWPLRSGCRRRGGLHAGQQTDARRPLPDHLAGLLASLSRGSDPAEAAAILRRGRRIRRIRSPGTAGLVPDQPKKPLHGDARFASHDEIQQAGLYGEHGVIVGKVGRRYLVYGGQEFVLLAAPTRSGKGVSIVLPNLLHYDESVVVLDIKMENFAYTSKFRQAHGHHVYLFNPFGADGQTHRWNPTRCGRSRSQSPRGRNPSDRAGALSEQS